MGSFRSVVKAVAAEGVLSATAPGTIVAGSLEQVGIAPDAAEIGMEMTQRFVAVGADKFGNRIAGLRFTWSQESGGTIDASGLFTAGDEPGDYNNAVKVTTRQGAITRSATTSVIVKADRIAFISRSDTKEESDAADIYIMNSDGSGVQRLTSSGAGLARTSWSPDGRRMTYGRNGDIFAVDDGGAWNIGLPIQTSLAFGPSWSPDGTKIAYEGWENETQDSAEIYVMEIDGGQHTRLTDNSYYDCQPSWSPDSTKLVFVSDPDGTSRGLFTMNSDGSSRSIVPDLGYPRESYNIFPDWAPKSDRIVYQSGDIQSGLAALWVIKLTFPIVGGGSDLVVGNAPAWTSDGERIVFFSFRDRSVDAEKTLDNAEVYVCVAMPGFCVFGTKSTARLTNNSTYDGLPSWAPRKGGVEVSESSVIFSNSSGISDPLTAKEVTAKVREAVVRIETEVGSGSGFLFDPAGLIMTNNHVITDSGNIEVCLDNGTCHTATVKARDMVLDLAVIVIDASGLPWLEFGDISRVAVGDEVLVAGYPLGSDSLSMTRGLVSSFRNDTGRNIKWLQTDAAINPGNSGGPLLNLEGHVLGVVSSKLVGRGIEGTSFAISANTATMYLDRLTAGGVIKK